MNSRLNFEPDWTVHRRQRQVKVNSQPEGRRVRLKRKRSAASKGIAANKVQSGNETRQRQPLFKTHGPKWGNGNQLGANWVWSLSVDSLVSGFFFFFDY